MLARKLASLSPIRTSLLIDAVCELAAAVTLAVAGARIADAFNLDRAYVWLAAGIFAAATLGIGALVAARVESRELVLGLAGSNISAGLAGWIALALAWGSIDPGGRWILAAAADTFVLVGILELLVFRLSASSPRAYR